MKRALFACRRPSRRHSSGPPQDLRPRTYYQVLGVDPEAQPFLIEAAYRALMRRAHPDKGGDTAQAQRINEAFRVLRDPASRARYDQTLAPPTLAPLEPEPERPPSRAAATAPQNDGMVSNAYVLLGILLVAAALMSARESFAGAREVSAAALNPQPFWHAPSGDLARLTLALRKLRS